MTNTDTYQPIACEMHSVLELAIMRAHGLEVVLDHHVQKILPIDIVTKDGAEFLIFLDQNNTKCEVRADKITLI